MANNRWTNRKLLLPLMMVAAGGCGDPPVIGPIGPEGDNEVPTSGSRSVSAGEIIFSTGRNGNSELYAMSADGSDPVNLTNHPDVDWRPAGSPDGSRVAFERAPPGGDARSAIYMMNADGSDPVEVMADASQPSWSPDGAKIAFWRLREDDSWWGLTTDVWVMGFDGSSSTLLRTGTHPSWSPDGAKIAYSDDGDIWVMGTDGSDPVNLTNHPALDQTPVWSPDGNNLAFVTDRDGNREVYVMGADGSNLLNLTKHPAQDQTPAWVFVGSSSSPGRR